MRAALVALIVLGLAPATAAQATVFQVTKTADTNDGVCDADCSLREAIGEASTDASGPHVVNVPAGLYPLGGDDLGIAQAITVAGSGPGATEIAAGGGRHFDVAVPGSLTIDGLKLTGGTDPLGAVIRTTGPGPLSIRNSEIRGNVSGGGGNDGRIVDHDADGALSITGSVIAQNTAGGGGGTGRIVNNVGNGSLTVADSSFSDNAAGGGTGGTGFGGAINNLNGGLTITASTFARNTAGGGDGTGNGGAVNHLGEALTISNSSFEANRSGGGGGSGRGGALDDLGNGPTTISNTTFSGNRAAEDGGGAANGGAIDYGGNGGLTITGSTFDGNLAGNAAGVGFGGAIDHNAEPLVIVNSTFSGNSARGGAGSGNGGAIEHASDNVTITNATFAFNSADGDGGGVQATSTTTLRNTILHQNSAGGAGANCQGVVVSQGHNLESANTCGLNADGDQPDTDAGIGSLAANGGPTSTHALLSGSQAIDRGDDVGCPPTDQRGGSRPQPPGGTCDIGAFEARSLADVAVAMSAAPSPATAGSPLTYTIEVFNNGPDEVTGASLADALPAGAAFVSATTPQGSCSAATPVSCGLGSLAPAGRVQVQIVATAQAAGILTNTVSATADQVDPDGANNSAAVNTEVLADPAPVIESLRLRPSRFPAARRGRAVAAVGTRVRYRLSEPANVRFRVQRRTRGRRVGGRCRRVTRRNRGRPRCVRHVRVRGRIVRASTAGVNRFRFRGRLRGRTLRPARYRLVARALDAAGNRSQPRRARFRILPRS